MKPRQRSCRPGASSNGVAPCSAYQTRAFVLSWLATLGKAVGLAPLFVAAKDAEGRVVALFCLGVEERGALRRAVFLGSKDLNFNLGLFRAPEMFTRADVEAVLRAAAKALGRKAPDIFLLVNQPHVWAGMENPFALLPHQPSPSYAYGAHLPRGAEEFFAAKQSKERRKKLRKKEARLAEMGALRHISNSDPEAARAISPPSSPRKQRVAKRKQSTPISPIPVGRAFTKP